MRTRPARPLAIALALVLSIVAVAPFSAAASEPVGGLTNDWAARESEHFRFFVQANDRMGVEAFVEAYGAYAETAYEEISLLFKTTAGRKISVYVYADVAAFTTAVQALERNEIDGIDAVADPRNLDISIDLQRFQGRPELEAENQIRHATSHILAGIASGFNIPRGFDEGLALYVERFNTPKVARFAALVQVADQRGPLASWVDLNRLTPAPNEEKAIEAQAYGTIAYLIQYHQLADFQRFLAQMKTTPGYRDAIKEVYAPADSNTLERQWQEKAQLWATTDWRWNLVAGFDLAPARDLLAKGNYRAAQDMLVLSETLFKDIDDQARRDEVVQLKQLCAIGIQAEALMADTQQALERHTYDRAESYLAKAKAQYDQLPPEQRPDELIAKYEELASAGTEATIKLDAATGLSQSWGDYREAREAAQDAGETFAVLGDEERRTQSESILSDLDTRQRRLVLMLGALAVLTLAWLALWLWARGQSELRWE
jgi:hypothetical protein